MRAYKKYQSCMVSKLRIIWKQTVRTAVELRHPKEQRQWMPCLVLHHLWTLHISVLPNTTVRKVLVGPKGTDRKIGPM